MKAEGRLSAASKLLTQEPQGKGATIWTVLETPTHRCATLCPGYSLKTLSSWSRDIIPMCWPNSMSLDFILLKVSLRCWSGAQYSSSALIKSRFALQTSWRVPAKRLWLVWALAASELYGQVGEMLLSIPGQKIYVPCQASLGSWTEIWAIAESSQRTVKNSAYPLCIMH